MGAKNAPAHSKAAVPRWDKLVTCVSRATSLMEEAVHHVQQIVRIVGAVSIATFAKVVMGPRVGSAKVLTFASLAPLAAWNVSTATPASYVTKTMAIARGRIPCASRSLVQLVLEVCARLAFLKASAQPTISALHATMDMYCHPGEAMNAVHATIFL